MRSHHAVPDETTPAPGLLILTGASHTGKTSVARAVLGLCAPPVAFLGVDDILSNSLVRPSGGPWEEISLAYELILPQTEVLLDRGWLAVIESTFTYVPNSGPPQFHAEAMQQLIGAAERRNAPWLLAQLVGNEGVILSRSDRTGRLSSEIVKQTIDLHRTAKMPASTLRLDTADASPEKLARQVVAALRELSPRD